jgi:hypothetical protein
VIPIWMGFWVSTVAILSQWIWRMVLQLSCSSAEDSYWIEFEQKIVYKNNLHAFLKCFDKLAGSFRFRRVDPAENDLNSQFWFLQCSYKASS